MNSASKKLIFTWILACIVLIYGMVLLGGYTRLSHSGLSIVEWKPVTGTIPPLSEAAWLQEFSAYQQSPEYQKINYGMKLEEFKEIFLVEYSHRLLGRIIGLIFFLPFIYFSFKGFFSRQEIKYFSAIGCLIVMQGVIGWLMVKSGLIDQPNVSQYRLALHLIMACFILCLLVFKIYPNSNISISIYGYFSISLLLLQITSGAFVAGLRAGLVYNSFPLMDGKLIPLGLFNVTPWYLNFFENITMVQFTHRLLAIINLLNILAYCYKIFNLKNNQKLAILLASLIMVQFFLGIITLLLQVPLGLGVLHQAVAILLLIVMTISLKPLEN